MKRIIHFDTSVGSLNIGDQIINECFEEEMKDVFGSNMVVKYPTHVPATHFYQNSRLNRAYRFSKSCAYKFIAGTNIISRNLANPWPNWNVNIFNAGFYNGSILVGCGRGRGGSKINLYTRLVYRRILSRKYSHSVRDEATKKLLNKYGYKAINTGCVTLWKFDEKFCDGIKKEKADEVVFTLTDYCKDRENDQKLVDVLNNNYRKVYFWPQGSEDQEYFDTLLRTNKIEIIPPRLSAYKNLLQNEDVDYVGTRLHAGIYAMRNRVRSIILAVDNRARDMGKDYRIPVVERENIGGLEKMINTTFATNIRINKNNITEWKRQFIKKNGNKYE